jgi:hypothetical protein
MFSVVQTLAYLRCFSISSCRFLPTILSSKELSARIIQEEVSRKGRVRLGSWYH